MADEILPNKSPLKPDSIQPTAPIGTESKTLPGSQDFSSLMKPDQGGSLTMVGNKVTMSPFDLAKGTPPIAQAPNLNTLTNQINSAQSTMGDLNKQLNYPDLKLKSSQKYLLKNKLTDVNSQLRAANGKMGAQIPPEPVATKFHGPLGKFLGYLSDGQAQLESAKNQLQSLKDKGQQLTPGDFLLVQVKMNKAQQELDFSSVLLSNAVQDFKMLMQVQI